MDRLHQSKSKLRLVGEVGQHKLSASEELIDASLFLAPAINDWSNKSPLQKMAFDAFGS